MYERYENVMKNVMAGTYTRNGEFYDYTFWTGLSAYDKLVFVNSVVDTLVSDNRYDSIVKDLIIDFNIVRVFTDIDTSFINVKDDDGNNINPINFIEEFLDETNVVDVVKENMESGLFDELNKAINLSIEHRTGIHVNSLNESLANLVNTIEKKINEIDLGSMAEFANVFSGISGEITPESIVNAYMASDFHKKNVIEIEDAKKQRAEFANDMDKAISSVGKKSKK